MKHLKQESLLSDVLPKAIKSPVPADPGRLISRGFLTPKTIRQLIAEQHVHPIASISVLSGAMPDEDVDEFVAEIYRGRKG